MGCIVGRGRVRTCVRAHVEDATYIGMEAVVRLGGTWARSSGCRGIGPEGKGQGRPGGLEEACPALVQSKDGMESITRVQAYNSQNSSPSIRVYCYNYNRQPSLTMPRCKTCTQQTNN